MRYINLRFTSFLLTLICTGPFYLNILSSAVETRKSPTSVRLASIIFADFDMFGGYSPRSLRRHLSTPLWRHVWTTVMSCLPGLRRSSPTNCNVWWMRRPAFWQLPGSSTAVWRSWCMTVSVGLTCLSASSTKSSSWLVAASSVPRHGI